jgi:hypothetical protein
MMLMPTTNTRTRPEEEMIAEPIAPDDGGDAVTSNDQHRLTVKPNQAATGFGGRLVSRRRR